MKEGVVLLPFLRMYDIRVVYCCRGFSGGLGVFFGVFREAFFRGKIQPKINNNESMQQKQQQQNLHSLDEVVP